MARLPSAPDFGARPTPEPSRAVVPIRAAAGMEANVEAGRALQRSGQQTLDFGEQWAGAQQRIQTQEEAVAAAKAISGYNEAAATELRRLQTEADLSDTNVTKEYGAFLKTNRDAILGSFNGSEMGRLRLAERMEGIRGSYSGQIGNLGAEAGRAKVKAVLGEQINALTTNAIDDPNSLPQLYAALDSSIDDISAALTPEDEVAMRHAGRQEITLSAVNSLVGRGQIDAAKTLFNDTPGLREMMTPAQQRAVDRQFSDYDMEQNKARTAGIREREALAGYLGRQPTMAELLQSKNLLPKGSNIESPIGKIIQDRQTFAMLYGEDSPQVRAFDELAQPKADLSGESTVRKEFTQQSQDFVKLRDAYNKIVAGSKDTTGASDMALVFSFMKILDPGSTVREGEYATATNTGGIPDQIRNAYNKALSGEFLSPTMRSNFVGQSGKIFGSQLKSQLALEGQYADIAKRSSLNPQNVVVDFIGPYRKAQQAVQEEDGAETSNLTPTAKMQYDLEGNPMNPGPVPAKKKK